MCTVSWIHDGAGYELFCNRDEKRSRAAAIAPRLACRDGVRYAAPVDGDFGGTWISVNEFGVTLCLLNGPGHRTDARVSRGLLVAGLLTAASLAEVERRVDGADLPAFLPFTLAVLERGGPPAVLVWDGKAVVRSSEPPMPLVSSSFDREGVEQSRRKEFRHKVDAAGKLDAGVLSGFHESHGLGPSAYSPCMHRADAATVSFTRVRVTAGEATMLYTPAAPCRRLTTEKVVIPCRSSF